MANDFRCDYCGKFIAYAELDHGEAECYMVTPDSEISVETYATHHMACHAPVQPGQDSAQGGRAHD